MAKNASVNIRVSEELKEKLVSIAKKKDTSLNDVTSTVLAEFVENYELEQVKDDEMPSAKQAMELREKARAAFVDEALETIKLQIKKITNDGNSYVHIRSGIIPNTAYIAVKNHLENLGYVVYRFEFGFSLHEHHILYSPNDIIIAVDADDISGVIDQDVPNNHQ